MAMREQTDWPTGAGGGSDGERPRRFGDVARTDWTPALIARLTELWQAGKSAGQIAIALDCGLTRNAVIGKLNRLGIQRGVSASRAAQETPSPAARAIPAPATHIAAPAPRGRIEGRDEPAPVKVRRTEDVPQGLRLQASADRTAFSEVARSSDAGPGGDKSPATITNAVAKATIGKAPEAADPAPRIELRVGAAEGAQPLPGAGGGDVSRADVCAIVGRASAREIELFLSGPVTIADLEDCNCHWPLGDPASDEFRFCGRPKPGAGPYCAEHHKLAHVPTLRPAVRGERRRPARFSLL